MAVTIGKFLIQVVYGLSPLPDMPKERPMTRFAAEDIHGVVFAPYVNRFLLG